MDMQVVYALAGVRSCVDYHSIAARVHTKLLSHLVARRQQAAQDWLVRCVGLPEGGDMLARDNNGMGRSLGMNVFESDNPVILQDDLGPHHPLRQLAEY